MCANVNQILKHLYSFSKAQIIVLIDPLYLESSEVLDLLLGFYKRNFCFIKTRFYIWEIPISNFEKAPFKSTPAIFSFQKTSFQGKKLVSIAHSTYTISDINFSDENPTTYFQDSI